MSDPVCHIPPVVPTTHAEPNNLPSIPPAQPNIASLVDTVNRMRQLIMILSGQQGVQGPRGPSGGSNDANSKKGTWTEQSRQVEEVKVTNPNDKDQYVMVERTNQLVMFNKDTKQLWTWNR